MVQFVTPISTKLYKNHNNNGNFQKVFNNLHFQNQVQVAHDFHCTHRTRLETHIKFPDVLK